MKATHLALGVVGLGTALYLISTVLLGAPFFASASEEIQAGDQQKLPIGLYEEGEFVRPDFFVAERVADIHSIDGYARFVAAANDKVLYVSDDGGKSWNDILLSRIAHGGERISHVAVDNDSTPGLYVSVASQNGSYALYSANKGQSFTVVYEAVAGAHINVMDVYGSRLFMGMSTGELVMYNKHTDVIRGIERFDDPIVNISTQHGQWYVIFSGGGMAVSRTHGAQWQIGGPTYAEKRNVISYQLYDIAASNSGMVFAASERGLWRSIDYGSSWQQIDTVVPTNTPIYALTMDDAGRLYVSAHSLVYTTPDGGESWRLLRGIDDAQDINALYVGIQGNPIIIATQVES